MTATEIILSHFEKISAIPRGSGNEAALRQWLAEWAGSHGFANRKDNAGNLAVHVPASADRQNAHPLILQAHMDMVCQKANDSPHDFTRDPIRNIRHDDWLKADKTTLGADNGIAIAIMLALAEDKTIDRPPLELLFTVEEETGLIGADNLDPSLLTGKRMINLDSEEDGHFTVGCSGGGTLYITLPVNWITPAKNQDAFEIKVGGLMGGHSGGDIHRHRANANKLMARLLDEVIRNIPIQLVTFKGGTVRNAIPRTAEAVILCPAGTHDQLSEIIHSQEKIFQSEFKSVERSLAITFAEKQNKAAKAINAQDAQKCVQFIMALPNGVDEMSVDAEGSVETSNNVGITELREDGFYVVSSQRSAVASRLEDITRRAESICAFAGASWERSAMSKPWMPNIDSPLLIKCVEVYESLHQQKPKIEVVHGGLECGILSDRCNGIDSVSLGPTIVNAHSPDEALHIPSLSNTWTFLTALLRAI